MPPGSARSSPRCATSASALQRVLHADDVLVTAPREIDEQDRVLRQRGREPAGVRDGMRRLERRQDAFLATQALERRERIVVVDPGVLGAADLPEERVL